MPHRHPAVSQAGKQRNWQRNRSYYGATTQCAIEQNRRATLAKSDKHEWEVIAPGIRLGYRGTYGRGGSWLVASRSADGARHQARLRKADDVASADGLRVLNHEQAKTAGKAWARSLSTVRSPVLL